jgi:hypothetical protein
MKTLQGLEAPQLSLLGVRLFVSLRGQSGGPLTCFQESFKCQ